MVDGNTNVQPSSNTNRTEIYTSKYPNEEEEDEEELAMDEVGDRDIVLTVAVGSTLHVNLMDLSDCIIISPDISLSMSGSDTAGGDMRQAKVRGLSRSSTVSNGEPSHSSNSSVIIQEQRMLPKSGDTQATSSYSSPIIECSVVHRQPESGSTDSRDQKNFRKEKCSQMLIINGLNNVD